MSLRGIIQSGRLILSDGTTLPNGTEVRVEAMPARARKKAVAKGKPGKNRSRNGKTDPIYDLGRFAVKTGIRDLAAEHDHYIYGTPKKSARRRNRKGRA